VEVTEDASERAEERVRVVDGDRRPDQAEPNVDPLHELVWRHGATA